MSLGVAQAALELKTKSSIGSLYLSRGLRLTSETEMEFTNTDDHRIAEEIVLDKKTVSNPVDRLSTVTVNMDEPPMLTNDSPYSSTSSVLVCAVNNEIAGIGNELSSSAMNVAQALPSKRRNSARLVVKKRPQMKESPIRGLSTVMEEDESTNSHSVRLTGADLGLRSVKKRAATNDAAPMSTRQTRATSTKSSVASATSINTQVNSAESTVVIGTKRRRISSSSNT